MVNFYMFPTAARGKPACTPQRLAIVLAEMHHIGSGVPLA
jgi:hypothetical protein